MPQDEEGLIGLPQRVHEASREDLLRGILGPLAVENPVKADIWDRVFGRQFTNQDLQGYLEPLDIDQTTKADIWDIRNEFTGHLPAAPIPKAEPPAPEPEPPTSLLPEFLRPPAEIPAAPTGLGELPEAPERVGVGPLGTRIPATFPPEGRVPYDVAKSREERALAGPPGPPPEPLELITPRLTSGYSPMMTVPGLGRGRFNFNVPPEEDEGTPGIRYAFDTAEGGRWFRQLEKEYQGGRWEDAWHAAQDFETYKKMLPSRREAMLLEMWGDEDIAGTIDRAAAAGKSLDELKDDLSPFNTHRQISTPRPLEPRAVALGLITPGVAQMLPPTPQEGLVRAEPKIGRTARELLQLQQFGQPGVRWEENVGADQNYQTLTELTDKNRRTVLQERFRRQPEVAQVIDFHAHHELPFDMVQEELADLDTVPPEDQAVPIDPMDIPEIERTTPEPELALARSLRRRFYPEPEKSEEEKLIERQAEITQQLAPMGFGEWASRALSVEGILERLPFSPSKLFEVTSLVVAAERFKAGVATEYEIQLLDDWNRREEDAQARGMTLAGDVAEVVSWIPGFGIEMALTGGFYRGTKKASMEWIRRFATRELPQLARRAARIRGARLGGTAAGSAARALVLYPTKGAPRTMEELLDRKDDDFLWSLFKAVPLGYADILIEVFSEVSGRAIGKGLGAVFGRIPVASKVKALKTATMMRWLNSNPGKTTADFSKFLQRAGWNGVFLEMMEERIAEPPRYLLGLEELPETGYFGPERLRQFLVEGLAFSVPGMGRTALHIAERGTRSEQEQLYEDIREFAELTRQGLTAEEIWQQSPPMIKDAITEAVEAGETVEDIIDVQTSVLADVITEREPVRPDRPLERPIAADVELKGEVPEPLFRTYPLDTRTQREQIWQAGLDMAAEDEIAAQDAQRLQIEEQEYERQAQARTEQFTEKWGPLPDKVAYKISNDLPINPKVEELVYAINSTGLETQLSGDLFEGRGLEGRQVVYVDIHQEDVERIDEAALPEGWALIPSVTPGVREWLGLPVAEEDFDVEAQEEMLETWRENYNDNRLIREGTEPVSPEDIDAIVAAMTPRKPSPAEVAAEVPEVEEVAPAVEPAEPAVPEEAERYPEAMAEAATMLAGLESEEEIEYAMDYRDYLFGEGQDPGTRLPIDQSGPIRMQLEEIGTRLGIPRPEVPTEIPPTPEVAPAPEIPTLEERAGTLAEIMESSEVMELTELPEMAEESEAVQEFWMRNADRYQRLQDFYNSIDEKNYKGKVAKGRARELLDAANDAIAELERESALAATEPTTPEERRTQSVQLENDLDAFPMGTVFELEDEDIPEGIEDRDRYTGTFEKKEDVDGTPIWVNSDSGEAFTSFNLAQAQEQSEGRFAIRPEKPSPNIVEEPEPAPPDRELTDYAEEEREENPGFLAPVETGQGFTARVIQGRGASLEEIYGPQAVKAGVVSPVAGAAQYYSFTEEHARRYGPELSTHDIQIKNAMVIDNDRQWTDLLDKADAYALYSVDQHLAAPEERPEAARRFQNYLRALGHDGIIVKVPAIRDLGPYGGGAKRLRETWGESQVVVFYENAPITVAEMRDAILSKTDISEEQVDAWIELLRSHAEGMGMTLQTWVDSRIAGIEGLPSLRRADGTLPPGALDTLLYQRRAPLTEAQFMAVWDELQSDLAEEKAKTEDAGGDLVEEAMQDLFMQAWTLRDNFVDETHLKDWFKAGTDVEKKAALRQDAEMRARGRAEAQSQDEQPMLPLAGDIEDQFRTAQAGDMFLMDKAPVVEDARAELLKRLEPLTGMRLTDAIKQILQTTDEPLTAEDILSRLQSGGFQFETARGTITQQPGRIRQVLQFTLNRLKARDQVSTDTVEGRIVYVPLPPPDIFFQRPNPLSQAEFMAVWEEQAHYLRVIAREITQDDQAAQDIRQDTFKKAWARLDRFIDKTHLKNWLNMAARRTSIDWRRKFIKVPLKVQRLGAKAFVEEAPVTIPKLEKQLFLEEIRQLVQPVIDRLPQANKEALLSMFDEVTARETAREMGINYSTLMSRRKVAFDRVREALADVDLERDDLFQRGESRSWKGATQFLREGRAILHILEASDISTLIHESAHIFRRDLNAADTATLEEWQGITDGKWLVQHEENVARAMERYLQEGVVPEGEPKLQRLFEKFKAWLRGIYETITGSPIDIQIPESVRPVLARMLGITEVAREPAEEPAIPPTPAEVEAEVTDLPSAFETVAEVFQERPAPTVKPPFVPAVQHRRVLEDLPANQTLRIRDGLAYSTNGTVSLITRTDLKDGLYSPYVKGQPKAFKKLKEDEDLWFPEVGATEADGRFTFRAVGDLQRAWRNLRTAEESRMALSTLQLQIEGNNAILRSTDGRRATINTVPFTGDAREGTYLIPRAAVELILKDKKAEEVEVLIGGGSITMLTDHLAVSSLQIEGEYPKFDQLMPDPERELHVDRAGLLKSLKTLKAEMDPKEPGVYFWMHDDGTLEMGVLKEIEPGKPSTFTTQIPFRETTPSLTAAPDNVTIQMPRQKVGQENSDFALDIFHLMDIVEGVAGDDVLFGVPKSAELIFGFAGSPTAEEIIEEIPAEEALPPTPEEEARSPHMELAYALLRELNAGEKINNPRLTTLANEAFGGTRGEGRYTPRDSYDAMEVALNLHIEDKEMIDFDNPEATTKRLRTLHAKMPAQIDRTPEGVEFQQFSSPPDLAFAAAYAAAIGGYPTGRPEAQLVALEPSAGTGAIAIMLDAAGAAVITNEKAPRRAQLLREQEFDVFEADAEFLHTDLPENIQPDVIVMNPPFSATGGRTKANATKYGAKHVTEALARLNEGGRLVAIVGQGMAMDRPAFRDWWNRVMMKHTVRANIGIAGKHYRKWGTSFGQQIIVIDKTGPHDLVTAPLAEKLEKIIIGKDLSPQKAISLLKPLAEEDISERVYRQPAERGIPPTPEQVRRGREGERGPIAPPGRVLPEPGPPRGYQPEPGPPGRAEPEELAGVEPGERQLPEEVQPGRREGPGVGEPGGPVEPGRTPGVGGVPSPGDIRPTEPVTGVEEGFGSRNTVFTKEEADKAREEIRKRLRDLGTELEMGVPPDLMRAYFKLGGYYFEGGLREFGPWSKRMLEDLGEAARPVLQSVFDTVKGFYEAKAQEDAATFTKERRQATIEEENPYSPYTVQKHIFAGSQPHPATIVESSYLATVPLPEPPVKGDEGYIKLPEEVITEGRLSDLQAEAVQVILQRFATLFPDGKRPGFWLGDGTGLGKGREIGAVIWDNWIDGRKRAVWLSTNHKLIADAQRDIRDLGAPMKLIAHQDVKTKGTIPDKDGILFTAYSFPAYHINSDAPRFHQLTDWLGPDFDGVIAFDESHLLKNAVMGGRSGMGAEEGTQRGRMAALLEEMYPKARFLYVSATGATVPRNMGYMTRLGLWGPGLPFTTFPDFMQAMARGGMGAMEMLSRDLKAIGAMTSRTISYEGVEYETVEHDLTPMEVSQYNNIADLWKELLNAFEDAIETANQPRHGGGAFNRFYNAQQRFFLLVMASMKLPTLYTEVAKDLKDGRSVIINLFNTNEGQVTRMVNQARADGIDLAELDFTPKQIIAELIERHFPIYEYVEEWDPVSQRNVKVIREDDDGNPVPNKENLEKQAELLDRLSDISFPENPLDAIVNHFGPQDVAEISGRKRRMEGDDQVVRQIKGIPARKIDLKEIERFQDGDVRIAVITGSAATGISLHSDLSRKNQQRRVFYAFQLNWSADVQLQSFGRAHRSSQAEPPIYRLLRTNLSAEERLVNATARRLASLGALTSGSREALGGNLFTIEDLTDVYGEAAVQVTYQDIYHDRVEGIPGGTPMLEQMGMADADGNVKQASNADTNVNRFLNRIMALHVDVQNAVFKHFYDHYQRIVLQAQQDGSYDMGIQPIRDRNWNKAERITLKGEKEVIYVHPHSGAETQLIELLAEFPVPKVTFEQSKGVLGLLTGEVIPGRKNEGWYVNKKSGKIYTAYNSKRTKFIPGLKAKDPNLQPEQTLFTLTNPKGLAHDVPEYQLDPRFNFDKMDPAEAERMWNAELELLPDTKTETIDILTGAVMPIYDKVVGLGKNAMTNLRIVRAVLEDGSSYIGMRIKPRDLGPLRERLGIGTPLGEATPEEIYNLVLNNGALIELDNGWRIRRTKVHGEIRVELDPRGKYNRDEMKVYDGVYEERLDFSRRFFIPVDETEGPKAVASILDLHKAVKDILSATDDPDLEEGGPATAGMPGQQPRTSAREPQVLPGELPGSEPAPYVTGTKIPATPGVDEPGAARTRLWAEGIPEGAIVHKPRKPEYMPGMPWGYRRLQKDWVDPVTGMRWPIGQTVPWLKVRVGQPGGIFPEEIPASDPLRQQAPDPILSLPMDFEMVMPTVNQWEGEDPGVPVSAPEVINSLIKVVEAAGKTIVVRTGRIAERAEGIFKIMVEVIRLAKALHIPAAAHEMAHALEKAIYGWEKGGPWIFRTHSQRKDLVRLGQERYGVPGEPGAVAPNYGYMREGWAEFFRIYVTGVEGEAKERAPHLYKWFAEEFLTEHKEVAEAIENARRVITKYRLQGTDARLTAQMPVKAPHVSTVRSIVRSINYMNWVESLAPIERLENMAMKIRGPDNPLPIVKRPFLVASSLRNLGPVTVNGWMLRSMTDIAGNAVGRPLKDVTNLLKATKIPNVQAKFMLFEYALRARERWNIKTRRHPDGMNPGITLADAEAYIEQWQNDKFWLAHDWKQEWDLGVLNYAMQGGLITERTLRRIMLGSTDYANLTRIFDDIDPEFFRKFDKLTRGGTRNPFPFFHGGGQRVQNIWTSSIERAVRIVSQTHQRIIIDLIVKLQYAAPGMGLRLEEVPRDKLTFDVTILRALEALAKESITEEQEELIEELREKFADEEIEEAAGGRRRSMLEQVLNFYVPAHTPKGVDPIVPIYDVQQERMRWYHVDGELYETLSMMDPYRLPAAMDFFFGTTTRAFRATTTALRPTFAWWRNLMKDPQTWAMQTQTNADPLKMAKTWGLMLADITFRGRKSPWFQQALRLGIEVSTPVGQDIRQIERAVSVLFHGRVPEVMLSPLDVARDWLSVPEYTTRAAEMKLIAQEFDKDPENQPGMGGWYPGDRPLTFEEATRLRLGIKRASVDFSAAGRVGRQVNQAMPFFNPQLQGMRQFLRVLTPEERKRIEGELVEIHLLTGKPYTKIAKGRIRRSFLWGTMVFVLPTLYFWWRNKDEDWYMGMPWWEKFTYWNIGTATKIWQIPRAHEYGPFFSAMTEAIFDAAYREDPEAMKQVMGQILRTGNPFSFPPPIQFAVEEWGNVDLWTGSPIIPAREQVYPPGMQRGRYTSKLAIMIGERWPRHWWTSPRRIDHAIRSFFGGLGPDLLQVLGLGVGPGVPGRIAHWFAPHDTEELDPLPTIGYLAFAQRAGGRYGIRDRYVDEFYEEWNRADQNYRWQRAMQVPAGEEGEEPRWVETIQELHYRNLLNDARYAMSLLNRMARDPRLTQEQLDHVKITQRQIAYDVLQKKEGIEPTPMQREAIIASQQDMTLDEQYRLVERLYIESQVLDNDPGSFWPKVRAMGLDPRRVSNLLNSTRLEIALLQISKAMIRDQAEIDRIDSQILQLQQRQALERWEGVSREGRFYPRSTTPPGVIPGRLPPTPSEDILNPRDPRAP